MTDAELIAAIRRIIRARPRLKSGDKASAEARDLARFDQIQGLVARHPGARVCDHGVLLTRPCEQCAIVKRASVPA